MKDTLPVVPKEKTSCGRCQANGGCCKELPEPQSPMHESSILNAPEQVLPTLRRDGSRNWLSPSLAKGFYWQRRRWLAYGLIAFFVTLPHLRLNGKPYVLIDIASRQFTFVGYTFYPTDTPLVACLALMAFFSIMLVTALAGRVWCGWACPQTVYLEFLFRPIDRFFDGTLGKGGKSRNQLGGIRSVAKFLAYLGCSLFLAHTFLSYFVGTDRLAQWMQSSPTQHPVAFLVMGGATIGLLFNFMYFREQFCMIACPYGRFQSVMLDRKSVIVTYDIQRGEPRKRGKRDNQLTLDTLGVKTGDCIECGRCTAVCPTGIDIRDGLQLECIHCTQCIDACDDIMVKIGKPTGLIRYSSQDAMAGVPSKWIRARTLIYPTIIGIAFVLFLFVLSYKFAFDARVVRMPGAPFTVFQDQHVQNNFRIRLVNRSQTAQQYSIKTKDEAVVARWSNEAPLTLKPGESVLVPVDVQFPLQVTKGSGLYDTRIEIADTAGAARDIQVRLLGPQ